MKFTVDNNSYLKQRGRVWWYFRRVPSQFADIDGRGTIRVSLKTRSLDQARLKRDHLADADDAYWSSLQIARAEQHGALSDSTVEAHLKYKRAQSIAQAAGVAYRPLEVLVADPDLSGALARLRMVGEVPEQQTLKKPEIVEAVLGGAEVPKVTISEAFRIYVDEIAINSQLYKSPAQRRAWEKTKLTSINYFIEFWGKNGALVDISRTQALAYKKHWAAKLKPKDKAVKPVSPNTANRHIGNIRTLFTEYFRHIGDETRQNPFRNIHFDDKSKAKVEPFQNDWVTGKILQPCIFSGLRAELQLITYMLIETGCRPSEIVNLKPEDFYLDAEVPYIAIRSRTDREIKTETSERDIPLLGVSLEAAKRGAATAFEHYFDKAELYSANMMKAFRVRDLFPSSAHRIYSFRHAFEKRMQEANIDYCLRCLLMGHKTDRPAYGDGGSLVYRRDELAKITHPFSSQVFEAFDQECPDWAERV